MTMHDVSLEHNGMNTRERGKLEKGRERLEGFRRRDIDSRRAQMLLHELLGTLFHMHGIARAAINVAAYYLFIQHRLAVYREPLYESQSM
jgi:hypothetical protein